MCSIPREGGTNDHNVVISTALSNLQLRPWISTWLLAELNNGFPLLKHSSYYFSVSVIIRSLIIESRLLLLHTVGFSIILKLFWSILFFTHSLLKINLIFLGEHVFIKPLLNFSCKLVLREIGMDHNLETYFSQGLFNKVLTRGKRINNKLA